MNSTYDKTRWPSNDQLIGLILVLAIHGGLLYGAWSYKLIPPPNEAATLFVNLINPPPKKVEPPPPEPPKPIPQKVSLDKPHPVEQPKPAPVLVANAPVSSADDTVAPPPVPEPVVETPPAPAAEVPQPSIPVILTSELSLACPVRPDPDFPASSRRLGEQGHVVLRVELDETGRIASVKVVQSSGFRRLDDASLTAVKNWQCNAAVRNGNKVRGIAMQPFDFILD